MQETCSAMIRPRQEEKLKIAVENTCELCHEYHPSASLEIHLISRHFYKEMRRDPSTRILVVCHPCHIHIHQLPLSIGRQRTIVKERSFFIRKDLRQVLGYKPKPYQAPDDINLFSIFEEYLGRSSPGPYRLERK
jgi:hypothetical protein